MGTNMISRRLTSMLSVDGLSVVRDPMLAVIATAPLLILAVVRFGVPALAELLLRELSFDLAEHYDFIVGFLVLVPPMLAGMIEGLIVLDERDAGILTYLYVTPLSRAGYLRHRVGIPTVLGFTCSLVLLAANGLTGFSVRLVAVALMAAIEAPMMTLFLAAFAANKVEAMAISKAVGILYYGPILAYFVDWPVQAVAMITPPYWVTKAFLLSHGPSVPYAACVVAGLLVHVLAICLLKRRFETSAT